MKPDRFLNRFMGRARPALLSVHASPLYQPTNYQRRCFYFYALADSPLRAAAAIGGAGAASVFRPESNQIEIA